MVLISQKVGTLCIEYRPPETTSFLVYDEGMFSESDCDQFVIGTKFFRAYASLLPIFNLDSRCYSQLRIRCYSAVDALDMVEHLDLQEFEFKFIPSVMSSPSEAREEFDVTKIEFEGSITDYWSMRIWVSQKPEFLFQSNRDNTSVHSKDLKTIYSKRE